MTRLALFFALAVAACASGGVDETGYLQRPAIEITGEGELETGVATDLMVVGNPGAVTRSGGLLTVRVARSGVETTVTVSDPDGSFVVPLTAQLGDELELTYDRDGSDRELVEVVDDLSSITPPGCLACVLPLFSPPDGSGLSTVNLETLDEPVPPFTAFNLTTGVAVRAEALTPPLQLPASVGDRACLYRIQPATSQVSAALCEDIAP